LVDVIDGEIGCAAPAGPTAPTTPARPDPHATVSGDRMFPAATMLIRKKEITDAYGIEPQIRGSRARLNIAVIQLLGP
jgi:hypothetical protein